MSPDTSTWSPTSAWLTAYWKFSVSDLVIGTSKLLAFGQADVQPDTLFQQVAGGYFPGDVGFVGIHSVASDGSLVVLAGG